MLDISPTFIEVAVPVVAGLLYAVIWYATRGLPRLAKVLARVLPLMVIVPAVLYVSLGMPAQRERATAPRMAEGPAPRDGGTAPSAPNRPEVATAPAPRSGPPPPPPAGAPSPPIAAPPPPPQAERAPQARSAPRESAEEATRGPPPGVPAAPQGDWDLVPVFYGTDRTRTDDVKRVAYGADRARRLELGQALVTVPRVHQVPKIERPFAIRVPYLRVTLYEQSEDPKLHFTIKEIKELSREDFLALARERVLGSRSFKDQAVVFVHGYNTSFDYALFRTAQMAYDLKFDGASFLYSWPSGGGVVGYGYDRESATQAEPYLRDFLSLVVRETGAKSVSVIAHSMGNLPLLNVLRDLGPSLPPDVRLNEIIFAAPDVDRDVFANLAANVRQFGRGVTLYCSANDRAMSASRRFAGGVPRAGDVPPDGPVVLAGMDTIDVTQASTDALALNHSTYAERSALLNDIGLLLQTGERPPDRRIPILQKVFTPKGEFWRYP
jgi:esterase/lipase superfamily enzyme